MLPYFGPEFITYLLAKCNGASNEVEETAPQDAATGAPKAPNHARVSYFWRYSQSFIIAAQLIRAWLI
jgi:hypothetical protein